MKKYELRIGNLLRDKISKTELKIIELTEYNIVTYVIDRSMFPLKNGWKIEPIPLTEEWLFKFGFEVYAESVIMKAFKIGFNEITQDYLFDLCWIKDLDGKDKHPFYKNGRFEIKYVHQLQNLFFALTNEELTIKL